jgi:hypothetical protein
LFETKLHLVQAAEYALQVIIDSHLAITIHEKIILATSSADTDVTIDQAKKTESEKKKSQLEVTMDEINQKIASYLDIERSPSAVFASPDKLRLSWKSIEGAKYHIKVIGCVMEGTPPDHQMLTLYENTIADSSISLRKDLFYDATKLEVTINGTIEVNQSGQTRSFDGKSYTVDVPSVHPTLRPTDSVTAAYNRSNQCIIVTALPVKYAEKYNFELIDENDHILISSTENEPQCSFARSVVSKSATANIRVRCQAVHSIITSSTFVNSNCLHVLSPARDLTVSLPHFGQQRKVIALNWKLVASAEHIDGFVCEIIEWKSKTVIFSKKVPASSKSLSFNASIEMTNLVADLMKHNLLESTPPPVLSVQISSTSNSEQIIDSEYVSQIVSSLPQPRGIQYSFSSDNNNLHINWLHVQETNKYGLEIKRSDSKVVWSKLVEVEADTKVDCARVKIPLSELTSLNQVDVEYFIEIVSVADGNDVLDSIVPCRGAKSMSVLHPPSPPRVLYVAEKDSLVVSFASVKNCTKYSIRLFEGDNVLFSTTACSDDPSVDAFIHVNSFLDKVSRSITSCSVQSLGKRNFLSSAECVVNQSLSLLTQPGKLECTELSSNEYVIVACSPTKQSCHLGFIDKSCITRSIAKLGTARSGDKVTATFTKDELGNAVIQQWACFAQTVLTSDSVNQLPSRHLLLEKASILPTPCVKSMQFDPKSRILSVTFETVKHASSYDIRCTFCDSNRAVLLEVTENVQPSKLEITSTNINLNSKVENWNLLMFDTSTVSVTVRANGSMFYSPSESSSPQFLKQPLPPINLACSYSADSDILTLTCQLPQKTPESTNLSVTMGLRAPGNAKVLSKTAHIEKGMYTVIFTGVEIRSGDGVQWQPFAQSLGSCSPLPSSLVTLPSRVKVLKEPTEHFVTFNEMTSTLFVSWSTVKPAGAYQVIVSDIEATFTFSLLNANSFLEIDLNKEVADWNEKRKFITALVIKLKSISRTAMHVNSGESCGVKVYLVSRMAVGIDVSSNEASVLLSLKNDNHFTYNVTVSGGHKPIKRIVQTPQKEYLTIPKSLFLYPTASPETKTIEVSVTASASSRKVPWFPVVKKLDVQTQLIHTSNAFGCDDGEPFDDRFELNNLLIVKMKHLVIHHDSFVDNLQATYLLADGSSCVGSSHGNIELTSTKVLLDFTDEFIIAVSALCVKGALCQLAIITQKSNGSLNKYGPFGAYLPQEDQSIVSVKFSGNVVSIHGQCLGNNISAIGFHYTYASPTVLTSSAIGRMKRGVTFDHDALTSVSQIFGIKSVKLQYNEDLVVSIQPEYKLSGGETHLAVKQGGLVDSKCSEVLLQFEDDEVVIEIAGKEYDNGTNVGVSQLSLKTRDKSGAIKEYGPYGGQRGAKDITIRGKILSFFGRSGPFVNGLGVYYCFNRTEEFGGVTGDVFDDASSLITSQKCHIVGIRSLQVKHSSRIISIRAVYQLLNGDIWEAPVHGSCDDQRGVLDLLEFEADEEIVQMKISKHLDVHRSAHGDVCVIGSVHIVTSSRDGKRKDYGPYGIESDDEMIVNGRVIAFFGRSGTSLNAIGLYYL